MSEFEVRQLAVLDVETSGLNPNKDRILEYGLVLLDLPDLNVCDARRCLVNPRYGNVWTWDMAEPEALAVNQLTETVIEKHGVSSASALCHIFSAIDWTHTALAGWGIDFDAKFAEAEFFRTGQRPPFNYRLFDIRSVCGLVSHLLTSPGPEARPEPAFTYHGAESWVESLHGLELSFDVQGLRLFADLDLERCRARWWRERTGRTDSLGSRGHDALTCALNATQALRFAQRVTRVGTARLRRLEEG